MDKRTPPETFTKVFDDDDNRDDKDLSAAERARRARVAEEQKHAASAQFTTGSSNNASRRPIINRPTTSRTLIALRAMFAKSYKCSDINEIVVKIDKENGYVDLFLGHLRNPDNTYQTDERGQKVPRRIFHDNYVE
jgi:hypothetical protein